MAPICVHRVRRTPPDIAPGHISSRDDLPEARRTATHSPQSQVGAMSHAFLQFTWHGNRHSRCLQGISARAMASICVHRAPRTPPDIAPGHIGSRDVLQKGHRKVTYLTQNCHARPSEPGLCPGPHSPAIHLARQSPFYGPPGHISSRDGTDLSPSSTANPSRHRSKAHPSAR